MKRTFLTCTMLLLAGGVAFGNAEDAAELIGLRMPLILKESVLSKGTAGSINTAWDWLHVSPENLPDVQTGRTTTLGVWQDGGGGEYDWWVFSQLANDSAQDAFGGGILKSIGESMVFGLSLGFYTEEHEAGFRFENGGIFSNDDNATFDGLDLRASVAWKLNDRMNLAVGLKLFDQQIEENGRFFDDTCCEELDLLNIEHEKISLHVGFKSYVSDTFSWNVHAGAGTSDVEGRESFEERDPMGTLIFRDEVFFDLGGDSYKLGGGLNWKVGEASEMAVNLYLKSTDYSFDNQDIFFEVDPMATTVFESIISDDITEDRSGIDYRCVRTLGDTEVYGGIGYSVWEIQSMVLSLDEFFQPDFQYDDNFEVETQETDISFGFRHHINDKVAVFGSAVYTYYTQDIDFMFTQIDDTGAVDFIDTETATWSEGDTNMFLGVQYIAEHFTLDALYEPEDSSSIFPFRGGGPSVFVTGPGSGRNSVASDRVTFAAGFHW